MNAQIPVELWTGHCVGTTTTSIVGSISKPIASIFLNEEHFLTLDKEVRNLYSFSPLKSSDQWQTSRSVRSKLLEDVNSHHGQQIRFVETRLKVACVAAGPRTRLNHLYCPYTEGLERLRRRQGSKAPKWKLVASPLHACKKTEAVTNPLKIKEIKSVLMASKWFKQSISDSTNHYSWYFM